MSLTAKLIIESDSLFDQTFNVVQQAGKDVAKSLGNLPGLAKAHVDFVNDGRDKKVAKIRTFEVSSGNADNGTALRVLKAIENEARDRGMKFVQAKVTSGSEKFWHKRGYRSKNQGRSLWAHKKL